MRHHNATQAPRWLKMVLPRLLTLSVLTVAGLPESQAQMSYSGGFTPRRHPRDRSAPQPSASPATTPAARKTPPAYFPDNDTVYPSYYPGSQPGRPLQPSVLPTDLPWNRADFQDYNEPLAIPRDTTLGQPKRYVLALAPLAPTDVADRLENALLIARLPEHAVLWVEGTRTRSLGRTRYFQSPPLLPSRKYAYRVSAAWIEDGRWVSRTRVIPVQAGLIQAIYLRPAP